MENKTDILTKLPFELNNEIYKYLGKHKTAEIIDDLIKCYNQDDCNTHLDKEWEFYNVYNSFKYWYFCQAREIYYEDMNVKSCLFDINFFNKFLEEF